MNSMRDVPKKSAVQQPRADYATQAGEGGVDVPAAAQTGEDVPIAPAATQAGEPVPGAPAATQAGEGEGTRTIDATLRQLFSDHFGSAAREFFVQAQAPGRLELAGNHTDHQGGCVISAGLARYHYALAAPNDLRTIRLYMEGFGNAELSLDAPDALEPQECEKGTSVALVRGMIAEYVCAGGTVRGFDLVVCSDLPAGAGVSSSAAFEMLIGFLLRALDGRKDPNDHERCEIALAGMRAEQRFFGKNCGAQDQIASAFGGMVFMNFSGERPHVKRVNCDFSKSGFVPVLINSGVDHSLFNDEYDRVPADMTDVAHALGAQRLCEIPEQTFHEQAPRIEQSLGSGVADRARHYYAETARVAQQYDALTRNDYAAFLDMVCASGHSSATLLRNVTPTCASANIHDELALRPQRILDECARVLAPQKGAWRIHGGGFGGSILAMVPAQSVQDFSQHMNDLLGTCACMEAHIAPLGARAWRVPERAQGRIYWTGDSPYGQLEISINLRKPEKDPRDIAAAAGQSCVANSQTGTGDVSAFHSETGTQIRPPFQFGSKRPPFQCDLCNELARYNEQTECESDPRISPSVFSLGNETWRLHFSPYGYFPKHCIALPEAHRPMHIDHACIRSLLACVERYPFYFMGCNADLPLVGGSILSHDHFQGGGHVFPLMRATAGEQITLHAFPTVNARIVQWPVSTLRLVCAEPRELARAAAHLVAAWRSFECSTCNIAPRTGETPHNTATLIAYKQSFVQRGASTVGGVGGAGAVTESAPNDDPFVLDIVLRNNRTSEDFPTGIFHVPAHLQHIKKENIGLIEIMGLAILPARLATEFSSIEHDQAAQKQIAQAFAEILEHTGVFKDTEQGHAGWRHFFAHVNDTHSDNTSMDSSRE